MLSHVVVFYANKNFFSLLKKAEQHLTDIYLISPFATPLLGGTVVTNSMAGDWFYVKQLIRRLLPEYKYSKGGQVHRASQ